MEEQNHVKYIALMMSMEAYPNYLDMRNYQNICNI